MENNKEMTRAHLAISGDVQGVFFRSRAREKARGLGVTGWVANESNGTVTVVAEGPENQVNELIDWCHGGPSNARVEEVKVKREPYMGEFEEFSVRY